MNNQILKILAITFTVALLPYCGSKKNPLFLLPFGGEESRSALSEEKKEIPTQITQTNTTTNITTNPHDGLASPVAQIESTSQTTTTQTTQNTASNTSSTSQVANSAGNNTVSSSSTETSQATQNDTTTSQPATQSTQNTTDSTSSSEQVANNTENTATTTDSNTENASQDTQSGTASSAENNQNDASSDVASNEDSSENQENSEEANNQGEPEVTASVESNNSYGNVNFTFNTTITIPINVTVADTEGPVAGALVIVSNPENSETLLQGVTNSNGNFSGEATVPTSTEQIQITTQIGNYVTEPVVVHVQNENNQFLQNASVSVNLSAPVQELIASVTDTDGDGISDLNDQYPEDATRASTRYVPNRDYSMVAFEDLYPVPGDADSNDIVLAVRNEEDLNAEGKVVRIRGTYIFLANHAGYNISPFLNLPGKGKLKVKVRKVVLDENLNVTYEYPGKTTEFEVTLPNFERIPVFLKNANYFQNKSYTNTATFYTHHEMGNDIRLYNEKNRTVSLNGGFINTVTGQSGYEKTQTHYMAELEFIFDEPVSLRDLASAPYDLHIYVYNTGRTVHFPGFYKISCGGVEVERYTYTYTLGSNGSCSLLAPTASKYGFPWVFIVPEKWNWPSNANYIGDAYPRFVNWYQSNGAEYENWYRVDRNTGRIYNYFENAGSLSAYLVQVTTNHPVLWTSLAILISGILIFLFLRSHQQEA